MFWQAHVGKWERFVVLFLANLFLHPRHRALILRDLIMKQIRSREARINGLVV